MRWILLLPPTIAGGLVLCGVGVLTYVILISPLLRTPVLFVCVKTLLTSVSASQRPTVTRPSGQVLPCIEWVRGSLAAWTLSPARRK